MRTVEYRSPEKFCPIAALGDVVQNFSGKLYLRPLEALLPLRVRFEVEQGQIFKFTVQLEYDWDGWKAVVRHDTAHGYAHCNII